MSFTAKALKTVPKSVPPAPSQIFRLIDLVRNADRLLVLTGAGISTESGIRDYRSEGVGEYAISTTPMLTYREFVESEEARRLFWLRNFLKWPGLSLAKPNRAHLALAKWESVGLLDRLVTQNVDGLHSRAGSERVLEFHGSALKVVCLKCKRRFPRDKIQELITEWNSDWLGGRNLGPESDPLAEVGDENSVRKFHAPNCPCCGERGILKPDVVFFGEEVPAGRVHAGADLMSRVDALVVFGSSLQVYSGYHFVHEAKRRGARVAVVNIGLTRADRLADLVVRSRCGEVLRLFEIYRGDGCF